MEDLIGIQQQRIHKNLDELEVIKSESDDWKRLNSCFIHQQGILQTLSQEAESKISPKEVSEGYYEGYIQAAESIAKCETDKLLWSTHLGIFPMLGKPDPARWGAMHPLTTYEHLQPILDDLVNIEYTSDGGHRDDTRFERQKIRSAISDKYTTWSEADKSKMTDYLKDNSDFFCQRLFFKDEAKNICKSHS